MEKWEIRCRFKNFIRENYFTAHINILITWLLSKRGLWWPQNLIQEQLSWVLWALVQQLDELKPNISVCLNC